MNRAREQAIRRGFSILEHYRNGAAAPLSDYIERQGNLISLEQSRLDINVRSRTSRLPWRGQFAPELIEYLISSVCARSQTILDPFCGSGTVLFESIKSGRPAQGMEVNPAAWHLASLACFSALSSSQKHTVFRRLKSIAEEFALSSDGLFSSKADASSIVESVLNSSNDDFFTRALAATIVIGMGNDTTLNQATIARGAFAVLQVLKEFEHSSISVDCRLEDARKLPLACESVDAIITSPPYINVFNYHQNYRTPVELLGWRPLEAARSEIGANRKHRMNRFLTVIQYCLDMSQCIDEMARALRPDAPLVIVLGRTSNVLGASFQNGAIFSKLLALSANFGAIQSAYRVFTNRFGEEIFEDILICRKAKASKTEIEDAREVGVLGLLAARALVPRKNRAALEEAIARAKEVNASPLLRLSVPAPFRC